jgi:hypothetical protein
MSYQLIFPSTQRDEIDRYCHAVYTVLSQGDVEGMVNPTVETALR